MSGHGAARRQRRLGRVDRDALGGEEADLVGVLLGVRGAPVQRLVEAVEQLAAGGAGEVEGAALDQRLDDLLVDLRRLRRELRPAPLAAPRFAVTEAGRRCGRQDALAEVGEAGERAVGVARREDGLDRLAADAAHGAEAEADRAQAVVVGLGQHGEVLAALVDVGRQDADAALAALGDVLEGLVGVAHLHASAARP